MSEVKKEQNNTIIEVDPTIQIDRVKSANIQLTPAQEKEYIAAPDSLGEYKDNMIIPDGYKRCGCCHKVMKFYLFNKNSGSKTNTTGNCKECQRHSASKSYDKTKKKRNYKKYYAENKEKKQAHARRYYQENKDDINAKHKEYLQTRKGQKVMQKAHIKRAKAIANNKGIPWKREWILDRDRRNGKYPICYLCGKPIIDTSGAACHMDHVVSICNGGLDCFTNIASVHQTCNLTKEKDDRYLDTQEVEKIINLAEEYIDKHPDLFDGTEE